MFFGNSSKSETIQQSLENCFETDYFRVQTVEEFIIPRVAILNPQFALLNNKSYSLWWLVGTCGSHYTTILICSLTRSHQEKSIRSARPSQCAIMMGNLRWRGILMSGLMGTDINMNTLNFMTILRDLVTTNS